MSTKLTDHKVLIFDVYGTLIDWETGIDDAVLPLLSRFAISRNWTREEALQAFGSVEQDLQTQFPDMLYSDLLAKVHQVLEQRLKAQSAQETTQSTLEGDPQLTSHSGVDESESASTSAAPTTDNKVDSHRKFGNSIKDWPIFPDTSDALHRLAKHFKLVVLSNVDRDSFQYTHGVLSEGSKPSDITPYLYPASNPNKFWHPQPTNGSKSPFTLIVTAQDTGCYKPATGGFEAVLRYIQEHPETFLGKGDDASMMSDIKSRALSIAQSLPHDHVPASQLGIKSVWIDRQSAVTCNKLPGDQKPYSWRFETLGELADAVEREASAR